MALLLLYFVLLAAVIVGAGIFLARSADAIGEHTGLGRSMAGMVLLAMGTSLPELTIGAQAARNGAPDLAIGDLLGASLFNFLTLAALDLIYGRRQRMLSRIAAAHAISAVMGLTLVAVVGIAIYLQQQTPVHLAFLGQDAGSWTVLILYIALMRVVYYDQRVVIETLSEAELVTEPEYADYPLRRAVPVFVAAVAVIFIAAPYMAHVCEEIAKVSGLGQSFVGTTLLAMATTLPEFTTTLTAVRMGAFDLAVGNVLGSAAFNMALIFGVDCFFPGPILLSVSLDHLLTAFCVIVVICAATLSLLYRAQRKYWLIEPDALLVVTLVIASLCLLYAVRG